MIHMFICWTSKSGVWHENSPNYFKKSNTVVEKIDIKYCDTISQGLFEYCLNLKGLKGNYERCFSSTYFQVNKGMKYLCRISIEQMIMGGTSWYMPFQTTNSV